MALPPHSYDVFLSFRGEDTRKTFTDHLYTAFINAGFRTFRDDDELERGEDIKPELQKAIQQSRSSVIVKVEKRRAALTEVADLAGMVLQNQADGHESKFIKKIVKVIEGKLSRTAFNVAPHPVADPGLCSQGGLV
ncbi:hypothetical protein L3X38_044505 [Prunus dulcis]|uniref:ADP-ribosyl cyclase/cyclic ADP-ribose hydrolase n=1 Tax=Prunus dulcis TaxID=3755 RepID=A0AAD4UYU5_PRUDU|nr:hypothetical protein L3X38_044505 [Prunus dulcis]